VGSVKTNIGHLEPVSGLASLVKSILILEKGVIPAHLNFVRPNPKVKLDYWNIRVGRYTSREHIADINSLQIPTKAENWQADMPRRISINNLGVGGSNTHIIVESLDTTLKSLGIPYSRAIIPNTRLSVPMDKPQQPQLITLSAMTENSLNKRVQALKSYCKSHSEGEKDIIRPLVYTLSKRWEGFLWRWSAVVSSMQELAEKMENVSLKSNHTSSNSAIGFIFAGQGAQWFAMGRELLTSYPAYYTAMAKADKVYRDLGSEWSLLGKPCTVTFIFSLLMCHTEELNRSKETSKVDDAAVGQPLSTALQVSLVDLLRSWNVSPKCVIGHSSGEIAAAYAAGALSFEHALTVAYFRGLHTSRMRKLENAPDGAMMAAGLSVNAAETEIANLPSDLQGKLVVACVNSPSSVTISGNRQAVITLSESLQERGIFSRMLKVDVAYHSSDMRLIADDYLQSIAHCLPMESSNGVEFWSSVRVSRLEHQDLRPEYWIENLVSQVKFCQGLGAMARETKSLALLVETSPHSVLDGPTRQILTAQGLTIPYASMLRRGANAAETALQAVQKMLESGFTVDLQSVNFPVPEQTPLLHDLPSYCWDHSSRYWFESAITARHLQRSFPYHELLGSRVPHSTPTMAQWRNTIKLSALDWLSDHRVNENIIFPGAGYLCIAMQAFQQYYHEKSYRPAQPQLLELQDITFERGLLLDDPTVEVEMVCYLRPEYENERETADSRYEFRVLSSIDHSTWQKHCRGTIAAVQRKSDNVESQLYSMLNPASALPLDRKQAYQRFEQVGLNYGPMFRTLSDGSIDGDTFLGHIRQAKTETTMPYIIHPATLDGIFQAMVAPHVYSRNCTTAMVPTSLEKLVVSCDTTTSDIDMLLVNASSRFIGKSSLSASTIVHKVGGDNGLSVRMEGFSAVVLESELEVESTEDHGCYQVDWFPDLTHLDAKSIQDLCLRSTPGQDPCPTDPVYSRAALHFYHEAISQVPRVEDVTKSHLQHLWRYMRKVLDSNSGAATAPFDISELNRPTAECKMLRRMGPALGAILRDEIDPLALMLEDGLLYDYYGGEWVDYYYVHMAAYLRQLAFNNPAMKILEIGAGSGGTTLAILPSMPLRYGFSYDFTDISAGFFARAKELLQQWGDSINFKKLDVERDPVEQGFEENTYDLIIASNVLHATKDIQKTLSNARTLLKPGGQLMLLEVTRPTTYLHLVFGCLAGWWLGSEDERDEGPCLAGSKWLGHLNQLGFSLATCIPDASSKVDSTMSVIIATLDKEPATSITPFVIIADPESNLVEPAGLQSIVKTKFNAPCKILGWSDTVTSEEVCIFVGSSTASLLISGNGERFKQLQALITPAAGAAFITSGATGDNGLPTSAAVTGLVRAIRSEADTTKFITIDVETQSDVDSVSAILSRCFLGETNETEFAVRGQTIQIPRLIPEPVISNFLSTGDVEESMPAEEPEMAVKLDFRTLGYLESLRFVPDDLIQGAIPSDEIQIAVKAAGVNFRHVLYALGKFSAAEYAQRPAGECAGIVIGVGEDVKHLFQVGDRVVTSGIFNAFTTIVRCPAASSRRIPDSMSFNEAASFPLTYITAWFALVNMAHIKKGDRVLIHSGTGAVGQIAIKIAQQFGAVVFATCSNDEKKAFLVSEFGIPAENVFSSKDLEFVNGILSLTKGRGVDIILNSLSGEYIPAGGRCLATFGRFVEIGKNDILGRSKLDMGIFNKSTSFMALDLSRVYELDRETIGELLQKMIEMLSDGSLTLPSPLHVRDFNESADAFRYMSTGKHIGKMVLDLSMSKDLKVGVSDRLTVKSFTNDNNSGYHSQLRRAPSSRFRDLCHRRWSWRHW
jgi:acyl transferase domain-containing protein/NADPH:quinone reductase-like Zn-dependent oxidoreductase/SAM-dependent methyltransferase